MDEVKNNSPKEELVIDKQYKLQERSKAIEIITRGMDRAREEIPKGKVATYIPELGSIAYAQDRNAKRENAVIYRRRAFSISALRASCENNSVRTKLPYICCIDFVKIMYLRVNSTLSDTAGDQLIVLPSEVYYKDPAF